MFYQLEIFNEVPQTTVTDTQSANDENIVPLDEDEEEQRRLENIDNSYIPFNPSNSNENITKSLDIEQLEYMQRLMNNRTALISDEQAETYQDLWSNSISRENRQDLYRYWLSKYAHLLAGSNVFTFRKLHRNTFTFNRRMVLFK